MNRKSSYLFTIALLISVANFTAFPGGAKAMEMATINLDIPFEFHVGDQKFDAGKYKIEVDPTSSLITLTNGSGKSERIIGAISSGKGTKNKLSRLVFYKYGSAHFLRKINAPTHSSNLRKSKAEKSASKNKPSGVKLTKVIINA